MSHIEFRRDFERLDLRAPSPREGREVGLQFFANGLQVVVWTTFLIGQDYARDQDAGWVLIKDGDRARYFKIFHRTKNFLHRLGCYAVIAKERAVLRPLCPKCRRRMNIVYGKGMKSRFWGCTSRSHAEPAWLSWDHGLPEAMLKFLKKDRRNSARRRAQSRAEGKSPGAAIHRRIGWIKGRPENAV